jgi:hypothetical protein
VIFQATKLSLVVLDAELSDKGKERHLSCQGQRSRSRRWAMGDGGGAQSKLGTLLVIYTGTCWAYKNSHYITNCVGDLELDIYFLPGDFQNALYLLQLPNEFRPLFGS